MPIYGRVTVVERRRHPQFQALRSWALVSGFHQTKAPATINRDYIGRAIMG